MLTRGLNRRFWCLQEGLIGDFGACKQLNLIFLCLQEGIIGDVCDYKQPTNLESMKPEKRLITKTGLRTGGLASNACQK